MATAVRKKKKEQPGEATRHSVRHSVVCLPPPAMINIDHRNQHALLSVHRPHHHHLCMCRYYVNTTFFRKPAAGEAPPPLFFIPGGEWSVGPSKGVLYGMAHELAEEHGGLMAIAEHRYTLRYASARSLCFPYPSPACPPSP